MNLNTLKPRKKRQSLKPLAINTFAFSFTLERQLNDTVKRGEMRIQFEGQPELLDGDNITEMGYKVLIGALADNIKRLAEQAETELDLKANELKERAISLLEVRAGKVVKLIGV